MFANYAIMSQDVYFSVFVFQEPIATTNIQRAELVALIGLQNDKFSYETKSPEDLDLDKRKIIYSTCDSEKERLSAFTFLSRNGQNSAEIVFFNQSALVVSNFELNIMEIVRRAGYIHSAGKFVFFCRWEDLKMEEVSKILADFCQNEHKGYDVKFYTESDNKLYHRKLSTLLIDDLRYFLDGEAFTPQSARLKESFNKKIDNMPLQASDEGLLMIYKDSSEKERADAFATLYPGRNIGEYALCYLSQWKKDNPIHFLDEMREAKPFWSGIFTTPHKLMSAMLNLAAVKQKHTVLDPFCYTGTVAIEASQIGCGVKNFDIAEPKGAEDNFNFFCKGTSKFTEILKKVEKLLKELMSDPNKKLWEMFQEVAQGSITLNKRLPEIDSTKRIEKLMGLKRYKKLKLNKIENRLLFYIFRRFSLEKERGFLRTGLEEIESFINSYLYGIPNVSANRKENEGYVFFSKQFELFDKNKGIVKPTDPSFKDVFKDYSFRVPRVGYCPAKKQSSTSFKRQDITSNFDKYGIQENTIDAVVTDPPYGYGEQIDEEKLKEIYQNFFGKSLGWLKSGGYLVFCALDKVKTGRTKGLLFTEQIMQMLNHEARTRRISFSIEHLYPPLKSPLFIYYWKSNFALNRSILAVQIMKEK